MANDWQIIQMLISGAVLPLLGLVFWLLRNDISNQNTTFKEMINAQGKRIEQLEETLHQHQLDVAKNYAQHSDLKDLAEKLAEDMNQIKDQYTALMGKLDRMSQYLSEIQLEHTKELAKYREKGSSNG